MWTTLMKTLMALGNKLLRTTPAATWEHSNRILGLPEWIWGGKHVVVEETCPLARGLG